MKDKDKDKELEENIKFLAKCCHDEYNDIRIDAVLLGSLDLITRQQAIVEKSEKVQYFADKTIATLQAENKYLNETINNLTLKKDALFDKVDELKVEVTKLNAENMLTMSERNAFRNSFYEVSKQLKTTKSEAVKEFAERLKHKSDNRFDYSELVFEISEEDIDNLLKEMVGENNDL